MRIDIADVRHEIGNLVKTYKPSPLVDGGIFTDLSSTVGRLLVYIVITEDLVD